MSSLGEGAFDTGAKKGKTRPRSDGSVAAMTEMTLRRPPPGTSAGSAAVSTRKANVDPNAARTASRFRSAASSSASPQTDGIRFVRASVDLIGARKRCSSSSEMAARSAYETATQT